MDTLKKITKIWHDLDIIIEKICIWVSNVLDVLGNFKYVLIGALMYEKSSSVIASDGCRFFSIMMMIVGFMDGFHKISTCNIVRKISKTTTNKYLQKVIDWFDRIHCMFIDIRLNMVLDYVCNILCALGIGILVYSMISDFNKDRASYGEFDANKCITNMFKPFGGWISMWNVGTNLYQAVMFFIGLYKKFSDKTIKYSNTSGVILLTTTANGTTEDNGEDVYEGNGQVRDTLFRFALAGLIISMITFLFNLIWQGTTSFSGWKFSTFIIGKVILILHYVMPSLRFSAGNNTVFLSVIFISLLTVYSMFGSIVATLLQYGTMGKTGFQSNGGEKTNEDITKNILAQLG
ncbi:hypothetical protein CWI42_091600 [Ordospora colligata]|nr:hypothetical protein CWI42_091600 [Ordospora colligata]